MGSSPNRSDGVSGKNYFGNIITEKSVSGIEINNSVLRYISPTNLCKLHVESHLLRQHADIVEEVRLHVTPHVWKPPELMPVL